MASTLLLVVLFLPIVAAIAVASLGPRERDKARALTLAAVVLNLTLTTLLVLPAMSELKARGDQPAALTFRPIYETDTLLIPFTGGVDPAGIRFHVGLDGLSIWLVLLTSFLMVPAVLVSWETITDRANEFYAWLLVLQTAMTGVFLAFDLILFYVFFELTLVPLYFLIGIWGGPMRRDASRKFFLYTLAGSLITLLGMMAVVMVCYRANGLGRLTFSIPELVAQVQTLIASNRPIFTPGLQAAIFLAMAVGFAIKVPLFPVHTWLPLAHVEAPTAGSVLLAGVLLKLGTYGFLRLCLPLVPDGVTIVGVPLLGTLAAIGIIYSALCAYAQNDIKKLVAYSSVSHLGFCVLGLVSLNMAGLTGSLLQMVNHGLSTGGLFLLVGMLYDRYHTRMMSDYGGMASRLKLLSAFMVFICLSSVGMPGLNGFIGEMLVLAGSYSMPGATLGGVPYYSLAVAIGIVLGGWYLFTMLKRVFFGPLHEPHHDGHAVADLDTRELATLIPVMLACLVLGLWPQPVIDTAKGDLAVVERIVSEAKKRQGGELVPRTPAVAANPNQVGD